ncbi:VCBS repeat-containing protein [Streptomyces sp. N2-109]|uniref:VCBS repeat-containing protein n=1 Tax=Streptomyces gossypii TaxID=2883101 RepID=A0ABT2JP54_9ACTN|nr:VCBS repeat-containing protein [Streptomyces gossypii]MCT2589662.1 VCBS repeat-containing protein [Streptomyces gossypii]
MMFTTRTAGTRSARTGVLAAALVTLLLAGCGGESAEGSGEGGDGKGGNDGDASEQPVKPAPVVTPGPTSSPVPEGKGSALADDMNGDGYPDLHIQVPEFRTAYILGSKEGLDPDTRIVTDAGTANSQSPGETADLDSDGYPETLSIIPDDTEVKGPDGIIRASRTLAYLHWGAAQGPRTEAGPTLLQLPPGHGPLGLSDTRPAVGDFDGDGNPDVAAVGLGGEELLLMYGPFSRDGAPARTGTRTVETGGWGDLITDGIDAEAKRPTGLLIRRGDDGEQAGNTLFAAGPGGLPEKGREVRRGSASAFGDFDGDGTRDVAIGDNGSRNNEPGYETEAPDVDQSLTVYYGGTSGTSRNTQHIKIPHLAGELVAADTDGDGRSELAVNQSASEDGTPSGSELLTVSRSKIEKRVSLTRSVPARVDGEKVTKSSRVAQLFDAADFNGDGKEELVLKWRARASSNGPDDKHEGRWWITNGTQDLVVFSSRPYAGAGDGPQPTTPPPSS